MLWLRCDPRKISLQAEGGQAADTVKQHELALYYPLRLHFRTVSGAIHPLIQIGHGVEFGLDALVAEGCVEGRTCALNILILSQFRPSLCALTTDRSSVPARLAQSSPPSQLALCIRLFPLQGIEVAWNRVQQQQGQLHRNYVSFGSRSTSTSASRPVRLYYPWTHAEGPAPRRWTGYAEGRLSKTWCSVTEPR